LVAQHPFTQIGESHELSEDVRALFDELANSLSHDQRAYSGECHPVLDVYETDDAVQIIMDVSGVDAEAIRILFRNGVILIAGEKAPAPTSPTQSFHLVEREFGRFARAVRVAGAFDVARATATLQDGELTVAVPKMSDRRGRPHRISIAATERPA
jgi:HSP20 family protein